MYEDCSHLRSKLRLLSIEIIHCDLVVLTSLPTNYNEKASVCSVDGLSAFIS
jgi:hypothetical protein